MSLSYRDAGMLKRFRRVVIALGAFVFVSLGMEPLADAEIQFIPALSVSGTYDSNVFYTPKSLLGPNLKPEDYYITITPQLIAVRRGENINGSLTAGTVITRYQNNPELDYTGINVAGVIDMTRWAAKFSPRIEALSVDGSYQFTPNISAFGASGVGTIGGGFGSAGLSGPLDAGLITNRVSMNTYTGSISGGYRLTPVTSMIGTYSYTQLSFGGQSGGQDNLLFDTTGHQGMAGITTQLSARDSVGTTATLSHYGQSGAPSSGSAVSGQTGSFTTITGMGTWTRQWTRELNMSVGGGGILTLPIETGIPGEKIKSSVTPAITTVLTYNSFSESLKAAGSSLSSLGPFQGLPALSGSLQPGGVLAPGRYSATLSYNLSVFPSYAIGAGPLKSHVVGANASGGITSNLTGTVGMNYAHGSASNPTISFDTVGLTAGFNYLIGSSLIASVTYQYLYFVTSVEQSTLATEETAFSKKMVTVALSYAFNGQSFFRPGSFGKIGGSTSPGGFTGPSPEPMKPN